MCLFVGTKTRNLDSIKGGDKSHVKRGRYKGEGGRDWRRNETGVLMESEMRSLMRENDGEWVDFVVIISLGRLLHNRSCNSDVIWAEGHVSEQVSTNQQNHTIFFKKTKQYIALHYLWRRHRTSRRRLRDQRFLPARRESVINRNCRARRELFHQEILPSIQLELHSSRRLHQQTVS